MRQKQEASALENETVSWWSWRPGIKPRNAFIIGGLLSLVALLLLCLGLFILIFGIEGHQEFLLERWHCCSWVAFFCSIQQYWLIWDGVIYMTGERVAARLRGKSSVYVRRHRHAPVVPD